LRPESVVILDTFGRSLTRPSDGSDGAATTGLQFDRQQQIERDLMTRVVSLLEPVVGAGRVRVNVAAYLNPDSVEETEERWDPSSVIRSRQMSSETGSSASGSGGVAGARANQPPANSTSTANPANAPAAAGAAANAPTNAANNPPAEPAIKATSILPTPPGRATETTNYEVSRLTRHTVSPQGQLAKLSVAVILDDERATAKAADGTMTSSNKPWDQAGLQRIQGLVAAAVGLDKDRGDQLTVENISFDQPKDEPEPAAPAWARRS
jgi:flagellar M-ring protein FliF